MRPTTLAPRAARVLCGAVLTFSSGCFSAKGPDKGDAAAPLGRFAVSGPTFGEKELLPGACSTGELQHFLGADFHDARTGLVVRLAVDPMKGPAVKVFAAETPFERALLFRREDCRVFHFSLRHTGWRINDVRSLETSLEVDCASPSGETLAGSARDGSCL